MLARADVLKPNIPCAVCSCHVRCGRIVEYAPLLLTGVRSDQVMIEAPQEGLGFAIVTLEGNHGFFDSVETEIVVWDVIGA